MTRYLVLASISLHEPGEVYDLEDEVEAERLMGQGVIREATAEDEANAVPQMQLPPLVPPVGPRDDLRTVADELSPDETAPAKSKGRTK